MMIGKLSTQTLIKVAVYGGASSVIASSVMYYLMLSKSVGYEVPIFIYIAIHPKNNYVQVPTLLWQSQCLRKTKEYVIFLGSQ